MNETRKRIDWEEVKNTLQESQRALEKALATDVEGLEAVYRERAGQLAHRRLDGANTITGTRVLVFALGTERYGLEFTDVVELLPFVNCTPVPGAPAALLGVINVQGEIRSVVDLGRLLELPAREESTAGFVLLVRKRGRQVGLRVDGIDKIQMVPPEEWAAAGEGETGMGLRFLKALGPDHLRLLSTEAVFAHAIFRGSRVPN